MGFGGFARCGHGFVDAIGGALGRGRGVATSSRFLADLLEVLTVMQYVSLKLTSVQQVDDISLRLVGCLGGMHKGGVRVQLMGMGMTNDALQERHTGRLHG